MAASEGSRTCAGVATSRATAAWHRGADLRAPGAPRHPGVRPGRRRLARPLSSRRRARLPCLHGPGQGDRHLRQQPTGKRSRRAPAERPEVGDVHHSRKRAVPGGCASSWPQSTASRSRTRSSSRPSPPSGSGFAHVEESARRAERRAAEIVETRTPAEVYRRHLADVTREHPGQPIHPSRVDAEIAVRMRLAGHHRGEIERAIKEAAPADRRAETRDWDAYAKRTAAVAFGVPGDRLAEHLRRQDDRFRRLEGRHRDEPERLPPGGPFSRFGLGR